MGKDWGIPRGRYVDGAFVCLDCCKQDEHAPHSAVYDRVASGKECARCQKRMPYFAEVRVLPDGYYSIHAPKGLGTGQKVIKLERDAHTLIEQNALVYVSIGCDRELGLTISPHGKVEVWIHDHPYEDGEEPSARWSYDPLDQEAGAS